MPHFKRDVPKRHNPLKKTLRLFEKRKLKKLRREIIFIEKIGNFNGSDLL